MGASLAVQHIVVQDVVAIQYATVQAALTLQNTALPVVWATLVTHTFTLQLSATHQHFFYKSVLFNRNCLFWEYCSHLHQLLPCHDYFVLLFKKKN